MIGDETQQRPAVPDETATPDAKPLEVRPSSTPGQVQR